MQNTRLPICNNCYQPGHCMRNCQAITCYGCNKPGHMKPECPNLGGPKCWHCNFPGHRAAHCVCSICLRPRHNATLCGRLPACSLCSSRSHSAIDCPAIKCTYCFSAGHYYETCIGCWQCGAKDHFAYNCKRVRRQPAVPPVPPVPWHAPPTAKGHNINMFDNLKNTTLKLTRPNRDSKQSILLIDPSGRGYFVNFFKREFHWSSQFGSNVYVAQQHSNNTGYIDFAPQDELPNRLFYYLPTGEKKLLRFQIGTLSSTLSNNLKSLQDEVETFVPGKVEVSQSETEIFDVKFEDGQVYLEGERYDMMDVITVRRCDIMIKHDLWELRFAVFEAVMPGRVHRCLVETKRFYVDLIDLVKEKETQIPVGLIVDLESETKRGNVVTHSALFEGKFVVSAEKVCSKDQHHIYESLKNFPTHPNILEFRGRKRFQNDSYFLFGVFESTLLEFIRSGNVENVNKWILEIVEGLLWLHERNICHGNIHPENIVITDNIAKLHGVEGSGNKNDDIQSLAALMYFCYSGIPYSESYIPTIGDCKKHLQESDFEAYDMVVGLLESRLQLVDILMHTKFWDAPKRGQFIQALGDATVNATEAFTLAIESLEDDVYCKFKTQSPGSASFVGLHDDFVQLLGGQRHDHNYRGKTVSGLARVLRHAYHHTTDSVAHTRICFGGDINKLDWCISHVYPRLVTKAFTQLKPILEGLSKFETFYKVKRA